MDIVFWVIMIMVLAIAFGLVAYVAMAKVEPYEDEQKYFDEDPDEDSEEYYT